MLYSQSTGGFYLDEVHSGIIPEDAVEITIDHYNSLLEGQTYGMCITSDANGFPILADPSTQIPSAVSPRQIRQALTRAGLREAVEQAVIDGDQDIKDWWEYSTSFDRQNAQVQVMADALGVSAQQLDDLWILASTL